MAVGASSLLVEVTGKCLWQDTIVGYVENKRHGWFWTTNWSVLRNSILSVYLMYIWEEKWLVCVAVIELERRKHWIYRQNTEKCLSVKDWIMMNVDYWIREESSGWLMVLISNAWLPKGKINMKCRELGFIIIIYWYKDVNQRPISCMSKVIYPSRLHYKDNISSSSRVFRHIRRFFQFFFGLPPCSKTYHWYHELWAVLWCIGCYSDHQPSSSLFWLGTGTAILRYSIHPAAIPGDVTTTNNIDVCVKATQRIFARSKVMLGKPK